MKNRILIGMIIVLLLAVAYCGWRYYGDVIRPEQEFAAADEAQQSVFDRIRPDVPVPAAPPQEDTAETQADPLAPAAEINPSVVGWISIPDTHIDFPVVQAEDNDFYLHNGFDRAYNYELGCPFLDCRCAGDFSGFNSIVYGHHMTKQRMFADIALFKDAAFMQAHPSGELTLHDGVHPVRFFAYLNVPSASMLYESVAMPDDKKQAYLEWIEQNASHYSDADIDENSHLLLLSTCTYEYDQARGVLVGVIDDTSGN